MSNHQVHFFRDIAHPDRYLMMYARPGSGQWWNERLNRLGRFSDGQPYGYPARAVEYVAAVDIAQERSFWVLKNRLADSHDPDPELGDWGWFSIPDLEAARHWLTEADAKAQIETRLVLLGEMEGSQMSLF